MKELAQDGNKVQHRQSDATALTSTLCFGVNRSWASRNGGAGQAEIKELCLVSCYCTFKVG